MIPNNVGEFKKILEGIPDDTPIAVQKNWGKGDYSIHEIDVWPEGHIGFNGVLLHMSGQYKHAVEQSNDTEAQEETRYLE